MRLSFSLAVFVLRLTAPFAQDVNENLNIYYDLNWKPVPMLAELNIGSTLKDNRLSFGPLPCSCEDSLCGCCVNMNINFMNFNRTGCLNFTYVPNEFAVHMDVLMNDESVYTNSLSGKNPPPLCVPIPYLAGLEFCLKLFDIYTEGRNIHMCVNFETRIVRQPILVLQFDCIQMGSDGLSHLKPTESSVSVEEAKITRKSLLATANI